MEYIIAFSFGVTMGSFIIWVIYGKDKEENHDWDEFDKPVDRRPIKLDEIPTLDRNKDKVF